MELRQLEYFAAVADEASFTRAAAKVHVAQPGVSAQIRRLERELGHDLLDRSGRTVRLTEVGAAVLPYARAALAAVEGARLAVDELTGLLSGHVAVGTITSNPSLLPDVLAEFHRDHPAVAITLAEATSDRLVERLRAGELDLALVGFAADAPPAGVELHVVVDQHFVAAVSHDDPLAAQASVGLKALRDRALICLPPGTGLRASLDAGCAAVGVRPQIAFEASDPQVLAQLASRGLGVAILPSSVAAAQPGELHALAITRPSLRGRLALAWRAEGPVSPAARALIARARAGAGVSAHRVAEAMPNVSRATRE